MAASEWHWALARDPGAFSEAPVGMFDRPFGVDEHPDDVEAAAGYEAWVHLGAVVAVATITGSHEAETCLDRCDRCHGSGEIWHDSASCSPCPDCNGVGSHRNCSPWAEFPGWGLHHWQVSEVVPLVEPVPARGRPGLWKPPQNVMAAVEAQREGLEERARSELGANEWGYLAGQGGL